jgi:cytochrome c5
MKIRIVALAVIGVFVFSCAPKVVTPVQEVKKDDEVAVTVNNKVTPIADSNTPSPSRALAEGKNLYENNCAKCHKLFAPTDYTAEQWTPIVLRMQKKAKIQDDEREKIYFYLTAK